MEWVSVIVAVLRNAWPFPDWKDEAAVAKWLPCLAPVIAKIANSVTAKPVYGDADWQAIAEAVAAELQTQDDLPEGLYGKIGDGTLIRWIVEHKEEIAKIIAFIIAVIPK